MPSGDMVRKLRDVVNVAPASLQCTYLMCQIHVELYFRAKTFVPDSLPYEYLGSERRYSYLTLRARKRWSWNKQIDFTSMFGILIYFHLAKESCMMRLQITS